MSLPSISQGQIAIDPVNRIFYYLDSNGNLVNSSLNFLQDSSTSIVTEENLTVNNITVRGSTTSIESTVTTLKDPIITLGGASAPTLDDNKDRGVEFMWHNGTSSKKGFFGFDDSTGKFTFIPDATNSSEVFSGSIGEINANITWDNVINKPTFVNSLTGTSNEINVTSTTEAIIISLPSTAAINISGTAVGWTTPRKITLSGDLEGNVFIDGGSNVTLSASIVTNSVTLGTDTTGDYVANLTSGTGITIVSGSGEQSQPIISVTNNIYDAFGAAAVAESNAATDASTKASTAYSNAVTHTNTGLSLKANIASPTFTGTVTTPILIVDVIEIDTTGATSGQVLRYNGTKFEPATESGPSGPTGATGPAGPATTDASLLISGILPDARLSAAIARISSPTFTGIPIAPTAAAATNTTQIATTAFVTTAVSGATINSLDAIADVTIATTYAIGDTGPAGGKIFITPSTVGNSTGKYFEVAPATETERFTTWATNVNSNQTTAVVGAGGTAIGTGEQNTIDIVAQSGNVVATCAATYAANFSYGLFSDWFLPSKDELAELFTHQASIGGFVWPSYGAFMYWSSTEADFDYAWINSFGSGYNAGNTSGANLKSYVYGIARAVRSFTPTSAANGDLLKWNGTAWVNDSALLAAKAPLASPVLTGTPTAPTAAAATNTTQVATTAFVRAEVAALVNSAGATLDTLGEIATALGNDASLSTTLTNSIALKAPLVSPTFTGTVTLPANTVTSSMILDETIANIDISSSAAIDLGKLADATIKIETASYTLQLTDKNKFIKMNITSTANTVTVPLDATVTFPEGSQIHIIQYGSGKTEVVGASGAVYIYRTPGSFLRAQYSSATLLKCAAANTWMLMGDLSAT